MMKRLIGKMPTNDSTNMYASLLIVHIHLSRKINMEYKKKKNSQHYCHHNA